MVKYEWDESNGVSVPTNKLMVIDADEYYVGMPLKKVDAETVTPTDGDPEYICLAQRNAGDEIRPLQIPVQEVFPDAVYTKILEDGTEEKVKFGGAGGDILDSNGKLKSEVLPEGYPYDTDTFYYDNSGYQEGDELFGNVFFKVSNDTPSYEDLLGAKLSAFDSDFICTKDDIVYEKGEFCVIDEVVIVVYADNYSMGDFGNLTAGIYMFVPMATNITLSKNGIKTIDPKFLPKITIVKDGYDDAAMGVAAAISAAETATANATFSDVMQGLITKTLPPIELYYNNSDGMLEHLYGGSVKMSMLGSGELYLEIIFFEVRGSEGVEGYKHVSWRSDNSIEVSNMNIIV